MKRGIERELLERIFLYGSEQEMLEMTIANDMIIEEITKVENYNKKAFFVGVNVMNALSYKFLKKKIYDENDLKGTTLNKFRADYFSTWETA
jgi:hypothetical protein